MKLIAIAIIKKKRSKVHFTLFQFFYMAVLYFYYKVVKTSEYR